MLRERIIEAMSTASISVTSAFPSQGAIPSLYTCEGKNVSPPLAWSGVPPGAKSLVLIVDDPDAPAGTWVHWVVYDIPPLTTDLAEGATVADAKIGRNDWGKAAYGGPCPPSGRHRYFFKVYALDTLLASARPLTKAEVEKAMAGHIIAQGELVGTYQKMRK
jgi:hypothetical protein